MWTIESRSTGHLNGSVIEPLDVLYEYDEPLIFTARIGFVPVLLRKMTQLDRTALFVAVFHSEKKVDLLKQGKLSVQGAFSDEYCWIVEVGVQYECLRYWDVPLGSIPSRYLPKSGVGLHHWFGQVPDDVTQANALFAIKFRGENLRSDGMPFGKFKRLVNSAYGTVRNVLMPSVLMGSRAATFDVEIAQPVFASLLIAVKDPVFGTRAISRARREQNIDLATLRSAVQVNREMFADNISRLSSQLKAGRIEPEFASQQFGFFDSLDSILPVQDGDIYDVQLSASVGGRLTTVTFNRDEALAIRRALVEAEQGEIVEVGTISGLTGQSRSILLDSRRGRTVRCMFNEEAFAFLDRQGALRLGTQLSLEGPLTRRQRIDLLDVRRMRILGDGIFN